ncbi:hypothetical protein BS47DRAFT_1403452 [Hydnum rufescens UP504]|uniref:Uncharacterized protein n=1 Tax=Hydnum rufescens UP504 TaxID=1448309 RepID=A0A9P6A9V3_9AGAM|nr:hypothetical protein BS47DRAFT_1403452 [Hydnum rufescens UP504]
MKPSDAKPSDTKPSNAKPSDAKPNETTPSQLSPNKNTRGGDTPPEPGYPPHDRKPLRHANQNARTGE